MNKQGTNNCWIIFTIYPNPAKIDQVTYRN